MKLTLPKCFLAALAGLFIVLATQIPAADMKIAFTSNRDGNSEIYVMNTNGTNPVRLTDNPAADSSPTWSPDGKRIAFTSNPNGSNPVNLTHNQPGRNRGPAWQPIPLAVSPQEKLVTLWGNLKSKQ